MSDKFTDRLSDYLDGELTPVQAAAVEAHVRGCAECTRTLEQLRAVVLRASQVTDRPPVNDLWPDITTRIAQPAETDVDVVVLPARRRVSFSVPQLVAASITLILLSSATMYLMLQRQSSGDVPQQVAQATPSPRNPAPENRAPVNTVAANSAPANNAPASVQPAASSAPAPAPTARAVSTRRPALDAGYAAAINELQTALDQNRSRLDTATVRILETNLRVIDKAIADARTALANDPGNSFLNRYLDQTLQKKVQLLRRATAIVRART